MEYQFFDFQGLSEEDYKVAISALNSTKVELPWTVPEFSKPEESCNTEDQPPTAISPTVISNSVNETVPQLQNIDISNNMASGISYPSPIPPHLYQVRPNIIIPSIYMDKMHNYPGVAVQSMPIMPFIPVTCGNIREIPGYGESTTEATNLMKADKYRKGRKGRKPEYIPQEHLCYENPNIPDNSIPNKVPPSYVHPYAPNHAMVTSPNQTLYFAHAAAGAPIYMMGNHSSHFPVVTAPVYGSTVMEHEFTHMHPGSVPYRSVDTTIQDCSNNSGLNAGSSFDHHTNTNDSGFSMANNVTTTVESEVLSAAPTVSGVGNESSEPPSEAVVKEVISAPVSVETPVLCSNEPKNEKTWASLFHSEISISKPVAHVSPVPIPAADEITTLKEESKKDCRTQSLADILKTYKLNDNASAVTPRGLINKSNWCYVNAVLQALLGCPPFYNLMKGFNPMPEFLLDKSKTPILDSLVEFVHEFKPFKVGKKGEGCDLFEDPGIEAVYIFKMLGKIQSDTFQVEGRQEDAEEFLSCLLNGLHEEMIQILKSENGVATNGCVTANSEGSDDEGWYQAATHKKKGSLTRMTKMSFSPVSAIFRGQTRSILTSGGQPRHVLQPFFSLQLDIQGDKVTSVEEAMEALMRKESVQGFTDPDTGEEVEAFRQLHLEHLPPVLILHLKRFVYNKNGGCQKVMKKIDFDVNMEISKDNLSPLGRNDFNSKKFRQYVLFAVVYHDGKEASKGHYIADVYHSGFKSWLRFDDKEVQLVQMASVLKYCPPRVPYILLYRRDNPHPI